MSKRILGLALLAVLTGACSSSDDSGKARGASTTGSGSHFFLPTGEPTNTAAPSIEVDGSGGIHAVYPQYAGGGAFYAYCPADCSGPEAMKLVPFETEGTVSDAMLALDATGRPRVLLASHSAVYFATPNDGDFTAPGSWTKSEILRHDGTQEVSGEAFALDPSGKPRFLIHTYKAYLGIGQRPPETYYVTCDAADCASAEAWKKSKVADEMWRGAALEIDKSGVAKAAVALTIDATESSSGTLKVAYVECARDCELADSWKGIALLPAYESDLEAVSVKASISLALTKAGAPRIAFLGVSDAGKKNIAYFECDSGCSGDVWRGTILSDLPQIGPGIDLALDANDHPRFVHTLDYNIGLASCDADDCTKADAPWGFAIVEAGSAMKPDEIFLYENCNVAAWFLHNPSLALTADGRARVGYQARDISGGFGNSNPSLHQDCVAGTDMTWSRLTIMP